MLKLNKIKVPLSIYSGDMVSGSGNPRGRIFGAKGAKHEFLAL